MKHLFLFIILFVSLDGLGQEKTYAVPTDTAIRFYCVYDTIPGVYLAYVWEGPRVILYGKQAGLWYPGYKINKYVTDGSKKGFAYAENYLDNNKSPIDPKKITVVLFAEKPKK